MRYWIASMLMVIAIGISIYLHDKKFNHTASEIDTINVQLTGLKKFLSPGIAVGIRVIGNVDNGEALKQQIRYAIAPVRAGLFADKSYDTTLFIIARGIAAPDTAGRAVIWQYQATQCNYVLAAKKSGL